MQSLNTDIDSIGGGGLGGFGNNPLLWLITLGFLKDGGIGGSKDTGAAVLDGQTQAKLDCLAQQHNTLANQISSQGMDSQFAAVNANMINLAGTSRDIQDTVFRENAAVQRILAECCCDLKAGQQAIKTDIALQTNTLLSEGNQNTQRVLDALCANQVAIKDSEIRRLQDALQTQTIIANCNEGSNQPNIDINVLARALQGQGQAA